MPESPDPIAWTESQRRALTLLTVLLIAYVSFRMLRDRSTVPDPPPARGERSTELHDRIDPNSADVATLAALPGLGEKRAADIVAYRDRARHTNPGQAPFRRPEDLLGVNGIGPAMMFQLAPYLQFPAPAPRAVAPPSSGPASPR